MHSQRSVTHNMDSKDKVANNVPKQVLPFCFVKVLPKEEDYYRTIQEAVRLFKENDQLHFNISERIREKVFERERMFSKLEDLKNYCHNRHEASLAQKISLLNDLHLALANFSVAEKSHRGRSIKSCTTEDLHNKKLKYMILHGRKNLTEEKQLLRNKNMCHKTNDAQSSPLIEFMKSLEMKYISYNDHYDQQSNCDKFLKEIKHFEMTRKKSARLKESIRNQVKIMSDELMEMRKKKQALETQKRHLYKQIVTINEEIWSFQKHLKDSHCRKEASLFMLQEETNEECWVLRYSNLEYDPFHRSAIFWHKSSSQQRSRSFHLLNVWRSNVIY